MYVAHGFESGRPPSPCCRCADDRPAGEERDESPKALFRSIFDIRTRMSVTRSPGFVAATSVGRVADWDGRGLPPVAADRARRAAAGGPWTSLLTAPAAAGLEAAGFDPVGEVMGSIASRSAGP